MTTIDHRILIPAGPEAVWEYVSDITHNPDWQIDCAEVIFLTSRREGPGVRWRYSAPSGHECVIAVTAWYNGLGYEYYFVDGVPYKENKGRIRLQEIPEGTIVQWTFTYEIGGLLGGMRNSLGVSRSVDFTISESLKTLYQKIKASGAAARPHESKSLMRDAPNVDARSAYQPRHPSVIDDDERAPARPAPKAPSRAPEPPVREGDGQRIRVVAEPPVAEDDTRRRKAAAAAQPLLEDAIPPDIEGEPDFLKQLVDLSRFEPPRAPAPAVEAKPAPEPEPEFLKRIEEPPISKSDTQPRKPVMLEEEAAPPVEEAVPVVPPPSVSPFEPPPSVSPFEPPPSVEDTEPVVLPAAAPPPAVSEEPTEPAVQVPDETQADYAIPARIYEWPRRETAEPTLTQAPDAAPPPPPRETEPEAAPPPPEVAAQMTPVLAELHVVEATPEATPPVSAPAAQVEAKPESSAPAAQVEPTPASLQAKPASETASIWEVFGIPRPSESDAAPTPTAAPSAQPEAPAPAAQIQPESAPVEPQPAAEVKPAAEGASIWEISDAQRPGETEPPAAAASAVPTAPDADTAPVAAAPQEVASEVPPAVPQAAVDLPVDAAATAERIALPPAPTRAGLRLALRRRLVDVRRP